MNNEIANILVVDDDPMMRLIAREILEQDGFVVHEADNGQAALRQFAATGADLILLDVIMPGWDGFATCERLRQAPVGAWTPIVMMTGLDDAQSIQHAYEVGATDFIVKPIIGPILVQRVRYVLRASAALREVAAQAAFQRALVETTPVPIRVEDAQGRALICNPAFEALFSGQRIPKPLGPASPNRPGPQIYEAEMLSSSQEQRSVIIHWAPFIPPGSDEPGVISAILDITERKQNEERLRLADTVFQTAADAIMVTDATGVIQSVNPAFTHITGYAPEEAIGQTSRLLKSEHHDALFYAQFWQILTENGRWSGEMWQRHKSGRTYPTWVSIKEIRAPDGRTVQYVAFFGDITQRKLSEQKLFFHANYDPLTGLPNRNLLHERIDQALKQANRHNRRVGLMFLDLDRFKQVNDTLGHTCGDALLHQTAERLKNCVRETDTVARYSGDEFVLVLMDMTHDRDAHALAEKIIGRIAEPFHLNGNVIYIGVSIGIVLYPDHDTDAATLLRYADLAMYQAKTAGRNTYRQYESAMTEQILLHASLEADLRLALDREELMVYYQPILDVISGGLVGAEALVRWRHPQRGLIPPNDFIPLAEETGLIREVGFWVLKRVCQTIGQWRQIGLCVPISVNVSSIQILRGLTVEAVQALLQRYDLHPKWLAFEITESVLISDTFQAQRWLKAVKALGIRVDIDDFGTGYSSLAYLKLFPIDRIKIDRAFVRDIVSNANDRSLVEAMLAIASNLHLQVVAEGVEDADQLALLRRLGCEYAQGFYFSRPVPDQEFIKIAGELGAIRT
ncbi:MAG: EAL domain-containing protein [Candidatus Contendobacter sp.]|nr:EAL domain-containing protein [Candidatus Contendobacter sp.]